MKILPITLNTGFTFSFTNKEYAEIQKDFLKRIEVARENGEIVNPANQFSLYIEPAIQSFIDRKL